MRKLLLRPIAPLALAALVFACSQENTGDAPAAASGSTPSGIEAFLLFPNPIGLDPLAQNGGTFETDTTAYAEAYYRAIDANNDKDTLTKWRAQNGFTGYATRPGTEHLAVFRDVKDLGYGRRMTARRNGDDGSIAFYVENYNVTPGTSGDYSSTLNVEAAIRRDTQWHVGTNAIEWSAATCTPGFDPADCDPTVKFAKYYNFSSKDGTRQLAVDLDGRGKKAMPGPCITCHGGRGDPLTPPDASTGKPRFPLVENLPSRKRGDVGAHLHGQNVDSFTFSSSQPGFAKSDLQGFLKDFNQWILCTYPSPTPGATVSGTWLGSPCTRPTAGANEWQGIAAEMIEAWYGGPGMPAANFSDTYLPAGWTNTAIPGTAFTQAALYQNCVAPYCRTCHILRGTNNQSDLDFSTFAKFQGYADRIKVHVFDRGNMPLSLIPHTDFWNSTAPLMLASFIDAQLGPQSATSASGAVLLPGRTIADPGPNRMVRTGANAVLTAENSLFSSTFAWSEPTPSGNVTLSNASGMIAVFRASAAGTYVVRLTVGNGSSTNSKDVTITVDDSFPDPLNIRFAQVKNVLQNVVHSTAKRCTDCHKSVATPAPAVTPPVWYTDFDRDDSGGAAGATDEAWFLKALSGRVNLTEIGASPLLRKPTGNHHNAGTLIDVADASSGGGLRQYSILYNWILAGMLPGGVAASAGADSSEIVTFSGAPLSASISLDGSKSIGAASYLWSVVSGPSGPTGALATISNPTSISAVASPSAPPTLNVPNVGTYVVRLLVSDGIFSDTAVRTITVTETPIVASFNPLAGSTPVTFSGSPFRGNITLASTSAGSPQYCQWQASGPAGATLEGIAVPATVTTLCAADATLNVPSSAIGAMNDVTLTAFGIGSSSITNAVTIADGTTSVVANLASTATPQAVVFGTAGSPGNLTVPTYNDYITGGFFANISVAVVVATVSLNGSASTTPAGTLSYSWCLSSQPDVTRFPASTAVCPSQTSSGTSATTTMTARATGSYTVQLTVTNGLSSNTISKVVAVNPFSGVKFSDFTGTSDNGFFNTIGCSSCHFHGAANTYYNPFSNNPNGGGWEPPQWENMTGIDGTTLYERVRQRVNLATSTNSLLLLNPSNDPSTTINTNGHGGGCLPGFNIWGVGAGVAPYFCPDTSRANYDNFRNWILDGAPPGN